MKTIFGPVPSRRLGRSLGIDVIPLKTCSYDCVYCESGRTTHLTMERRAFVDPGEVIRDLEAYFKACPGGADVLTFSSGGEPTLYEPLGELIASVKKHFPSLPLMVLTNGSLLWDPRVRRDLLLADRVVPSLDGATPGAFARVNRPHPMLDLEAILEGLIAFRREYRGELHLEVLLVDGGNDGPQDLEAIRRVVDLLVPDRIELNTIVRPPADPEARGLPVREMERTLAFFPPDRTSIIGTFRASCDRPQQSDLVRRIIDLVTRRPCTAPEMAVSLGAHLPEIGRALSGLVRQGRLIRYPFQGKAFFKLPS